MSTKKIASLGMLLTVAILFGYVETLIPMPIPVPGVKIGMANAVIIFILYVYSWKEAVIVSLLRILLTGFLFGNLSGILFSVSGAFCSLLIMILLKKIDGFSLIAISMAGGATHNTAQLITAMFYLQTKGYIYYLPILLAAGLITGLLIGMIATQLYKHLQWMKE